MKTAPMCFNCKRFNFESSDPVKCEAFPNGVPSKIIDNDFDHRKTFKGDNGLKYDPIRIDFKIGVIK